MKRISKATKLTVLFALAAALVVRTPSPAGLRQYSATDEGGRTFRCSTFLVDGTIAHVDESTYRIEFDQSGFASAYRSYNAFVSTMVPTDRDEIVRAQAAGIFVAHNTSGADNVIAFPALADVSDRQPVKLSATASSGWPVAYFVDSGPAVIEGDSLQFAAIPPRSKFPVEVRVVAWQWGRGGTSPVKSAEPVYVTFHITKGE
jgi:hypothetical protein